jgi:hypothetical protein
MYPSCGDKGKKGGFFFGGGVSNTELSHSEEVNTLVPPQDDPLPIWDILEAELTNTLRHKVFWGDLETDQSDF